MSSEFERKFPPRDMDGVPELEGVRAVATIPTAGKFPATEPDDEYARHVMVNGTTAMALQLLQATFPSPEEAAEALGWSIDQFRRVIGDPEAELTLDRLGQIFRVCGQEFAGFMVRSFGACRADARKRERAVSGRDEKREAMFDSVLNRLFNKSDDDDEAA
jgi:hypothetical protein